MASGTINGSAFGGGYLYINWSSTNNAATNASSVWVQVCLNRYMAWETSAAKSGYVMINGTRYNYSCSTAGSGPVVLYEKTVSIPHDGNGNAIINITGYLGCQITWSGSYVEGISCAANVNLGQIPRGTTISSFVLKSVEWTTASFSFTTTDVCSEVWAHINGGGRVPTGLGNVSSGTFTLTGLAVNKSHTITLEVIRNGTGVSTTSSPLYVSTKFGCKTASVQQDNLTSFATIPLTINNSDGGDLGLYLYIYAPTSYGGTSVEIANATTKFIGVANGNYDWILSSDELTKVNSALQYTNSCTFKIMIVSFIPNTETVAAIIATSMYNFKYNDSDITPTLSGVGLSLDSTTTAVLGNSTYLLQNISTVNFSLEKSNIVSKLGSTLRTLVLSYGAATKEFDLTSSATSFSFSISGISSTGNYNISLYATDSRGTRSATYTKTYNVLSYSAPIIVPTVTRELNSGGVVDMTFTARYSRLLEGTTEKNGITLLQYGYAKLGTNPSSYANIAGYTTSNAANGVDKTVSFSKVGIITVDANANYQFVFKFNDKINSYITTIDLVDGNPIMRILENGQISINCKPDTSKPNEKLRVNGDAYFSGSLSENGKKISTVYASKTDLSTEKTNLINMIYPVGSIYMSAADVNPETLMPGTKWESFGQGRTVMGVDVSKKEAALSTGGEATHVLTTSEMPSHNHTFKDGSHSFLWGAGVGTVYIPNANAAGGSPPAGTNYLATKQNVWNSTNNNGSGTAHNNLPPYIRVYMWKRTS